MKRSILFLGVCLFGLYINTTIANTSSLVYCTFAAKIDNSVVDVNDKAIYKVELIDWFETKVYGTLTVKAGEIQTMGIVCPDKNTALDVRYTEQSNPNHIVKSHEFNATMKPNQIACALLSFSWVGGYMARLDIENSGCSRF
jgi:hypothetical protein